MLKLQKFKLFNSNWLSFHFLNVKPYLKIQSFEIFLQEGHHVALLLSSELWTQSESRLILDINFALSFYKLFDSTSLRLKYA